MRGDRIHGDGTATRRALIRRSGLVLGLALVVVLAGSAGSASASVAALERVSVPSPSDSSSNKSATASCPSGKQVTGAGGRIISGSGQVVLRQIRPNAALTSVTVQGAEDQNGYPGDWSLSAFAICATPPAGLERVSATSPSDSSNKGVTAACPAAKRLLGTGAELAGGGGQVALNDILPGSSLGGVTARGLEDEDGTAVNWSLTAYAICANPVAGRERVVATSPTDSDDKFVTATCPDGKRVTGAGAELAGGGGEVVLDELLPDSGLTSVEVVGFEDENGTASNWSLRAFAICAAASERVAASSANNSSLLKEQSAACPTDMSATGVGADITGGGGQVRIHRLILGSDSVLVAGGEDDTGTSSSWFLRAYAICTTPFGLTRLSESSGLDSSSSKAVTVTCPSGTRVLGAGGQIFHPSGSSNLGLPMLNSVSPNAALTSVTATGFEDENGYGDDWSVVAGAVCASPPPGLQLVSAEGDPDSDPASGVTATCPSGKNLLATGAEIVGGLGQVGLDDVRPNPLLTTVTVTGLEDETGHAGDWFLRAHALCANA